MKTVKFFRPFAMWLEEHILKRRDQIEKYEFWGLVLFVGIPLPGTGAWTGTLAASILDFGFKKTCPAVFSGLLLAGLIMMTGSVGIANIVN